MNQSPHRGARHGPALPERSGRPLEIRELRSSATGRSAVAERRQEASREALRRRVRGEFDEMHGICLTLPQAQRLFGLRDDICARVLNELIEEGILVRRADSTYGRRDLA